MTSIDLHEEKCPYCGAKSQLQTIDIPKFGKISAWVYPCNCKEPNLQAGKDKRQIYEVAGVDTSATKRCDPTETLAQIHTHHRGCFVHGHTGVGKTTLLDAIATRIVEGNLYEAGGRMNCKKQVRMCGAVELFESLRGYNSEHARDRLDELKACDWLFLDDLGQERSSEWVVERLYELLDARYRCGGYTCVSSNYKLPDLGRKWAACDDVKARVMVRRLQTITFDYDMDAVEQLTIPF